jgi:hypothetical protein
VNTHSHKLEHLGFADSSDHCLILTFSTPSHQFPSCQDEHIRCYITVPNTPALAASSASAATTNVTQTITKTIPATAHASLYAAVNYANGSASSLASAVPLHPMNQAADLFERAPKGTFTKLLPLLAALKCELGVMVVFGIGAAMKPFPVENVPPGEDPRTWRQKATFAYNFLKNGAKDNEQLRRSIREA